MVLPEPNPNHDPKRDPDIRRLLDRLHEFVDDLREQMTRIQYFNVKDALGELEDRIEELEDRKDKWLT